ncbi:uncharacterized protein LOC133524016 isoform X1 [Cydia pomonella]|uniref:uncharacterized protein LOC133524016 isoform X1 n=1 Tax=Cydia pomonella TaxID=82600 RepID=UPI002ADE2CF9|nr:uncharacterized protein LOC133524016 isoform X1 [Cydia pomonella]
MNEHKILVFIAFLILYCLYCLNSWFKSENVIDENAPEPLPDLLQEIPEILVPDRSVIKKEVEIKTKTKRIPLFFYNACSVLEVFTEKPALIKKNKTRSKELDNSSNAIAVIGITVFLVALGVNAVLDALKAKEEERERRKLNPDGERRQSLSEFANKKQLRRESSRFGIQLFQIAESVVSGEEKSRRQSRPYTRGDSTNSYLSDRKAQADGSTPTETAEPRLVKRQSVAKLFGGRPVPMVRRSSFPALPLNPDVQALMLGHRQPSCDSDDEDGKGRRVRIIRRY